MILILNCSYKGKKGNTQYFLEVIEEELIKQGAGECKLVSLKNVFKGNIDAFVNELENADAFVIGAPLYVDGLPAQAVRLLEYLLENDIGKLSSIPVYVVSNLGFYESLQIRTLFDIVENWCQRTGMIYGGGLAVGAGPMVSTLKSLPMKSGPNKNIGKGIEKLAEAIRERQHIENCFAQSGIPRVIYMQAAHTLWAKTAKANGLTVKDVK